jgi:hypothetical protein
MYLDRSFGRAKMNQCRCILKEKKGQQKRSCRVHRVKSLAFRGNHTIVQKILFEECSLADGKDVKRATSEQSPTRNPNFIFYFVSHSELCDFVAINYVKHVGT